LSPRLAELDAVRAEVEAKVAVAFVLGVVGDDGSCSDFQH